MSQQHTELYDFHAAGLSRAEEELLAEHEPGVVFSSTTKGLSQGRQSRVSILSYQRGSQDYRLVWKRMGASKGLTEKEAVEFHERLRPYRESLISGGWRIPQLFHTRVVAINR